MFTENNYLEKLEPYKSYFVDSTFSIEKYNFQIKRLNLTKLGYDYLIKYVDFEKLKELEKDIKY